MSDADSLTARSASSQWAMDQYIADNSGRIGLNAAHGTYSGRNNVLQQIGENQFPLEDSELIFKAYERSIDSNHARASYYQGQQLRETLPSGLEPMVSIVFLPGPDRMAVAALEQKCMIKERPNQKSAAWRVHTAGTLLCNFEVDDDLHITQSDCTPHIAATIRQRLARESANSTSQTSLVLRKGDDRLLTIDSDSVTIVSDLATGTSDIEATLIEVDKTSLSNLLTNFRQVLTSDAKGCLHLLEVMIEDARRLAIRSPVLFRMSTRQKIINSKNTRYGLDHGTMFETITTSAGIKNIILKSDACYHSLSNPGRNNNDQATVKPRFLQMLTLLLSLVNDTDLRSIASFLEDTYRIKADRTSIELLVLKTLPLASINSKIFVTEMVNAIEQRQYSHLSADEEDTWNVFVGRMLQQGYILPGFTEQMGQRGKSWLVRFPPGEGFKDSYVFNNLQYQEDNSTINEIPAIDLGTDNESGEVTVVLNNGRRYLIDNADVQKIVGMIYGDYSLTEADGQRRTFDLNITEEVVNQDLTRAIQKTNQVLRIVNSYLASSKLKGKIVKYIANGLETLNLPRPKGTFVTYEDIRSCGRLTWHQARLGEQILAVAYKVEGKKVSRRDLIRNLAADLRSIRSTLKCIEYEFDRFKGNRISEDVRQTMSSLRGVITEINQYLEYAEQRKAQLERVTTDIADEPIQQTIYPGSLEVRSVAAYWAPYQAKLHDQALFVKSRRETVCRVVWRNEEIAEIYFIDEVNKFFVSPLRKLLPGEQESEIKPGDKVLLLGQYIAIVDVDQPDSDDEDNELTDRLEQVELPTPSPPPMQRFGRNGPVIDMSSGVSSSGSTSPPSKNNHTSRVQAEPEIFANWMKVVGVEKQLMDRRKVNRPREKRMVQSVFH